MRAPLVDEHSRRLINVLRLSRSVDAVIERQLDGLSDQGLFDQDMAAVLGVGDGPRGYRRGVTSSGGAP